MTEPTVTYYTLCDRTGRPLPPVCEGEADRIVWVERAAGDKPGYLCEMRRGHAGAWCGYVTVPVWHPWRRWSDLSDASDDAHDAAHGGITYVHEGVVGFDCAHYRDLPPSRREDCYGDGAVYRTQSYVMRCVRALAAVAMRDGGAQ